MRKSEFMDLLKYYFRKADKDDLKGIIEDCEEQFRLGAKEGKSEEEICVKLGSPKNIYRYYMGKPIVPEDNPRLPNDDFDARRRPKREPYDWEKDEDLLRRRQQSQQYYRTEAPAAPAERDSTRRAAPSRRRSRRSGNDKSDAFTWSDNDGLAKAGSTVLRPVFSLLGTLFTLLSGILYTVLLMAVMAGLFMFIMPTYLFFGLVPIPPLSLKTIIFTILALLFAGLAASAASSACHAAARGRR